MSRISAPSISKPIPMSPVMAIWLGTFVAAGCNVLVSSVEERDSKRKRQLVKSGLFIGALGPLLGVAMWKVFSWALREQPITSKAQSLVSIIVTSVVGTSLLETSAELEAVNLVIWLRVASGVWALAGRGGVDLITAVAVAGTFHGVLANPSEAPRALVRMTRQFLGPAEFDSLQDSKQEFNLNKVWRIFSQTFRGLFAYNYFLHIAAALVSFAVRSMGKQLVRGVKPTTGQAVIAVLQRALREATVLNLAVSLSCALLYSGCRLGQGRWQLGVLLVPLPLMLTGAPVRDTVYFLFVPWFIKYLFALYAANGGVINSRSRIVLGVLLLEKPLKQSLHSNHEGYSWMVSVAFGIAQRLAGNKLAKW
ncbi:hypothetical protein BASA81_009840 [Batrachochytrium salamandrivorans]|nr:hypothetical protein BASA81_009840 [Batrachochytrium salamandrivorans]